MMADVRGCGERADSVEDFRNHALGGVKVSLRNVRFSPSVG